MNTKGKIAMTVGVLALVVVGGVIIVQAASITTINLIGNVNFKFHKLDMSGAVDDQLITLPTTVGNNGQVRIGKRVGSSSSFRAIIVPAAGDTIDDTPNKEISLFAPNDFVEIVADEAARVWWVVNIGTSN